MNGDIWHIHASFGTWIMTMLAGFIGGLTGLLFRAMTKRIDVLKEAVVNLAERIGQHDVTIAVLTGELKHIQEGTTRIEHQLDRIERRQSACRATGRSDDCT